PRTSVSRLSLIPRSTGIGCHSPFSYVHSTDRVRGSTAEIGTDSFWPGEDDAAGAAPSGHLRSEVSDVSCSGVSGGRNRMAAFEMRRALSRLATSMVTLAVMPGFSRRDRLSTSITTV